MEGILQQRLVNRIDHLMIRVAERDFAQVQTRFSEALSESVAWPYTERLAPFLTCGYAMGNVDIELFRVSSQDKNRSGTSAELYGIALEPALSLLRVPTELTKRDLSWFQSVPVPFGPPG